MGFVGAVGHVAVELRRPGHEGVAHVLRHALVLFQGLEKKRLKVEIELVVFNKNGLLNWYFLNENKVRKISSFFDIEFENLKFMIFEATAPSLNESYMCKKKI